MRSLAVALVMLFPALALAAPGLEIRAQLFQPETGLFGENVFQEEDRPSATPGEMLVTVRVTEPDASLDGKKLVVTTTQGKSKQRSARKLRVGAGEDDVLGYPVFMTVKRCGAMTITAKVGSVAETRTLDFDCK